MTTAQPSTRVAALLERTRVVRGRLIFALDATGSREAMWDLACQVQSEMFAEASKIGGLEVQLVHYGGQQCSNSPWTTDPGELAGRMRFIRCEGGVTQIRRVLEHVREENTRKKVDAVIFVGDSVEEVPHVLYAAATGLGVPLFVFQEGDAPYLMPWVSIDAPSQKVEQIFRELARLTNGAYVRFDADAAGKLGELLRAVAAFAVGGVKALANQHTDSARRLLTQMK